MNNKIHIGLLYGGTREELALLEQKAAAAARAWNTEKYEWTDFPFCSDGSWPTADELRLVDVAFPVIAGYGWDAWRLCGLAEMAGVPCVGPGWKSAAVGSDLLWMRKLLAYDKLPQGLFRSFTHQQWERDEGFHRMEIELSLGYPCRLRPISGPGARHSLRVGTREELAGAAKRLFGSHSSVLAEEFPLGRVFAAALIGGASPEVSSIGEVVAGPDGASLISGDHGLSGETLNKMKNLARRVYASLDAYGLGLVRFVMLRENLRILVDEWESLPEWSQDSIYAKLWALSGVTYGTLMDRLVELAMYRHSRSGRSS